MMMMMMMMMMMIIIGKLTFFAIVLIDVRLHVMIVMFVMAGIYFMR